MHLLMIIRKRRAKETDKDQSPSHVYENPDYLTSTSQGNSDEMTHCPAYESADF